MELAKAELHKREDLTLIDLTVTNLIFLSLTKDMTGKEDVYRGPAIRALCRITDVSSPCFAEVSSGGGGVGGVSVYLQEAM